MSATAYWVLATYAAIVAWCVWSGVRSRWASRQVRVLAWTLLPAGVVAVFSIGLWLQSPVSEEQTSATAQKQRMVNMAAQLKAADRKGDAGAAAALLDSSTAVFRALNPTGAPQADKKDCLLAIGHLSDGITDVMRGGSWMSQSRFEAALADCKH